LSTPLTINYTTQDGTATAGSDYTAKSGSVTFNRGDRDKFVDVDIIGDNDIENNEYLDMVISGSSYIVVSSSRSYILNDDGSYPSLSFDSSSFSVVEGNSSQRSLNFTLSLDKPAIAGSHFDYYTQDGTSSNRALVSDNDYIGISRTTYTFNGGERNITIPVTINGDVNMEGDEEFYLKIDNESIHLGITGTQSPKGVILNDDGTLPLLSCPQPTLSITEGDSGTKSLTYSFLLDNPAIAGSSFDYETYDDDELDKDDDDGDGDPHGVGENDDSNGDGDDDDDFDGDDDDVDYGVIPKTTYTFSGGETNVSISTTVSGDTKIEKDEKFSLLLSNFVDLKTSSCSTIPTTIVNDDGNYPQIHFSQPSYSIAEGNSGQRELNVTLTLDAPALANTHIDYYTHDNTAQDGSKPTEDSDYVATHRTLNINENATTATITVQINGDTNIEPDESFELYIENPQHLQIASNSTEIVITNDDASNQNPFVCDEHMYLSSSVKRGSTTIGKMWLHRIDTTQSPFRFEVMDDNGSNKLYNAIAYNPDDNYIYGLYHRELIRLSQTGTVLSLGTVSGLPSRFDRKQLFAGAIYGGYYYVTGRRGKYPEMYKINLSDKNVSTISFSKPIAIQDFSFSSNGQFLYGVGKRGKLTKIEATTGNVTEIGANHTGFAFDSTFSDVNDRFFANDSNGNGFYEFNLNTGAKSFISNSQPATYNDGANCLNASLVFTDYGDAPSSYGTPRHNIANGIYMGNEVDHDIQAYSSLNADGDDVNGIDDEDGVTLIDGSDLNGKFFAPNTLQELNVTVSKAGYLNVWIDYNLNGTFDASEKIFSAKSLTAGSHILSFTTPRTLTLNQTSYIRFRFSSTPTLDATQSATDGEVEDYAIKFGTGALRGKFNIERTNSGSYPLMSDARNAWYTQIVGRDFDYSLVFYKEDFSAEQNISNVTVSIDLMDMDTNTSIYNYKFHIPDTVSTSRIDMTQPMNDLASLPATKNAQFKVTYGVDNAGNIVQENCLSNPPLCSTYRSDNAKDNFAIRPDYYYMTILDNGSEIRVNTHNNNTPLRVAAGYDYNLSVVAHDDKGLTAVGYTINDVKRVVEFLDKSNANALVKKDYNSTDDFINGSNTNTLLEIPETGNYRLSMIDTLWTKVDSNKGDCIENNSSKSANGNVKSGCDIVSPDINLSSYPDHFVIELTAQNLPHSTHDNFIYMSPMSVAENNISISFAGSITAKNADNNTTKNFTANYFAEAVALDLNTTILSDRGINVPLKTSDGVTSVNIARTIELNHDGNITLEKNPNLSSLTPITLTQHDFTNGAATIDIRYNIDKNITKTINPIQITFHGANADSTDSYSIAHQKENPAYIPTGHQDLDATKNFYFAKVTPDKYSYPRVNTNISSFIRTPLSIDIFCDKNTTYCTKTGVIDNTVVSGTTREQAGWYISINHNGDVDGNVTNLNPNFGNVTLDPNPTPSTPLALPKGHNGMESATFNNCSHNSVKVTIVTDPVLNFQPNSYILRCTDNNASQWTGVGETGNVLEVKPNVNKASKMEW
jgi:hypothetical protein